MASRERISPKGQFISRKETLGKFGERVGRLFYEDAFIVLSSLMHSDANLREHTAGSDEELITIVRDQVLGGLAKGILTAGASFDVENFRKRRSRAAVVEDSEDKDDVSSICAWTIAREYWSGQANENVISWANSTATVPSALLISTDLSRESVAELYADAPEMISVQVWIIAPDAAIRKATFFEQLPTASKVADYVKFVSLPINAAIAAAWRLICIKKLDFRHGQTKYIVEEVDRYLIQNKYKSINIDLSGRPTRATLEAVVSQIRQQFLLFENDQDSDHAEVPVLLNSTPSDRARKPPSLF